MDRREFAGMTSLGILGGLASANKLEGVHPLLASGPDDASQNRLPEQDRSNLRSLAIHRGARFSGTQSSGASSRVFNMVPGMEALPLVVEYPGGNVSEIQFEISVS